MLAVHTAWGRTLKDVFQRYRALRGFDQRYQNGFDCQGLWIEVGVERELGFNSKREIESYGLAEFARRCREKVVWSAGSSPAARSGSASGWTGATTTSRSRDTNIEYIWRFLKIVHERGWLYTAIARPSGARAAAPRSPSTSCPGRRLPRRSRPVALRPLPAPRPARRVAGRLDDDAVDAPGERRGGGQPRRRVRPARRRRVGRPRPLPRRDASSRRGLGARRPRYGGPVRPPPARRRRSTTGSIPWDEVSLEEGTGIVHIAPGLRPEDFELAGCTTSPCSRRSTRPAASTTTTAGSTASDDRGRRPDRRATSPSAARRSRRSRRAPLPALLALPDAADLPRHRRLVHRGRRSPPDAPRGQRDGRVDAGVHGQAHGRLAAEHGRLEHLPPALLRASAALLPVRVRAT